MKKAKRKRLSSDERRASILLHAVRSVGTRGFKSVSVRDIAHTAGINEALIYHHFPSKRALLEAVVEKIRTERPALAVETPLRKEEFFDALRRFEGYFTRANAPDGTPLKVILYSVLEGYPLPDEFNPEKDGTFLHWMRACIERGRSEWGFSPDLDAGTVVSMFMGSLVYQAMQTFLIGSKSFRGAPGICTQMLTRLLSGEKRDKR